MSLYNKYINIDRAKVGSDLDPGPPRLWSGSVQWHTCPTVKIPQKVIILGIVNTSLPNASETRMFGSGEWADSDLPDFSQYCSVATIAAIGRSLSSVVHCAVSFAWWHVAWFLTFCWLPGESSVSFYQANVLSRKSVCRRGEGGCQDFGLSWLPIPWVAPKIHFQNLSIYKWQSLVAMVLKCKTFLLNCRHRRMSLDSSRKKLAMTRVSRSFIYRWCRARRMSTVSFTN